MIKMNEFEFKCISPWIPDYYEKLFNLPKFEFNAKWEDEPMKQKVKCIMCNKENELPESETYKLMIVVCNNCGLKDICAKIVKEYENLLKDEKISKEIPRGHFSDLGIAINDLEMFVEGLE